MSVFNINDTTYDVTNRIMSEILNKCRDIADSLSPVFIIGEYGSGKCWVAEKIHEWSRRRQNRFSRINCYSMHAEEIERALYGYLSFNGDRSVKINRGEFEKCNDGTLYFDGFEILPKTLQNKIINTVVSKSTKHVGSTLHSNTDVRLIVSAYGTACQNKNNSIRNETLIYEINPHILFVPPLRNRRDDIASLIRYFLNTLPVDEYGYRIKGIHPDALYTCIRYHWPGNVRQLKNAINLAILLSGGEMIRTKHLPESIRTIHPADNRYMEAWENKSYQEAEKNLLRDLLQHKMLTPEKIASEFGLSTRLINEKILRYKLGSRNFQTTIKERTKS